VAVHRRRRSRDQPGRTEVRGGSTDTRAPGQPRARPGVGRPHGGEAQASRKTTRGRPSRGDRLHWFALVKTSHSYRASPRRPRPGAAVGRAAQSMRGASEATGTERGEPRHELGPATRDEPAVRQRAASRLNELQAAREESAATRRPALGIPAGVPRRAGSRYPSARATNARRRSARAGAACAPGTLHPPSSAASRARSAVTAAPSARVERGPRGARPASSWRIRGRSHPVGAGTTLDEDRASLRPCVRAARGGHGRITAS